MVLGVWAFFWPESFYDNIALFKPYNLHLLHDAGGFQLGLGAALLAAPFMRIMIVRACSAGRRPTSDPAP